MSVWGGIEAGGTKFVCVVGSGPDAIRDEVLFLVSVRSMEIAWKDLPLDPPLKNVGAGQATPCRLIIQPGRSKPTTWLSDSATLFIRFRRSVSL